MNKQEIINQIEKTEKDLSALKEELKNYNEPWKPGYGNTCWYVNDVGRISSFAWYNCPIFLWRRDSGNCFRTRQEAIDKLYQLEIEQELKKLSEESFYGVSPDLIYLKYVIYYSIKFNEVWVTNVHGVEPYGQYFFSSQLDAQKAIKKIGEDRLKKYLFKREVK